MMAMFMPLPPACRSRARGKRNFLPAGAPGTAPACFSFLLLNPLPLRQPPAMRILIATVTAGGGHIAAAAALEEAWHALRPDDTIERLDLIKFFSPIHKKVHEDGYVKLIELAPELWGMIFGKTDNPKVARSMSKLRRAFPSNSRNKFIKHLKQFKPDVVLCTHYLPLETLGLLRLKNKLPQPLIVSIVTDFEAHALWMDDCVDLYCVATEGTKARLVARG